LLILENWNDFSNLIGIFQIQSQNLFFLLLNLGLFGFDHFPQTGFSSSIFFISCLNWVQIISIHFVNNLLALNLFTEQLLTMLNL